MEGGMCSRDHVNILDSNAAQSPTNLQSKYGESFKNESHRIDSVSVGSAGSYDRAPCIKNCLECPQVDLVPINKHRAVHRDDPMPAADKSAFQQSCDRLGALMKAATQRVG